MWEFTTRNLKSEKGVSGMTVGELIGTLVIDNQALPVKYSDGRTKEDLCLFNMAFSSRQRLRKEVRERVGTNRGRNRLHREVMTV